MKLKKLVPAALSLALVLSLAACGSPSEPSGSTPPDTNPPATGSAVPGTEAPAADDSLQKVLDAGKLTIAAEGNWVPYVYNEDGTGELTGFEVDIAKEICSRLGVEPDFQISSSWDPVEAGMDSGRYDCIICGVNPKPERQEKYNMSIAYAENPFCLVVAGDNEEITSFADLAGRSCANALNSTAGDLARKAARSCPTSWALKVLQSLRRAKNGILDITAHSFPQKRPCFQPTPAGRPPNREPNNVGRGWRRRTARPG